MKHFFIRVVLLIAMMVLLILCVGFVTAYIARGYRVYNTLQYIPIDHHGKNYHGEYGNNRSKIKMKSTGHNGHNKTNFSGDDDANGSNANEPEGTVGMMKTRIPKIIHQTYKTLDSIPGKWLAPQQLVRSHNPEFDYLFWTDESLRIFIQTNYPSFLPTYDSYPYTIQRIDAARYFLLYHYGGFYIDLDIGEHTQLDVATIVVMPYSISSHLPFLPMYSLILHNCIVYSQ